MSKSMKKKKVQFNVKAESDANVFVAGTFNGWNPTKHKLRPRNGGYSTKILLAPGIYEYKFIINGSWVNDIQCESQVTSELGTINNVIVVK